MKKLGLLILVGIFALSISLDAQNVNRGQRQGRNFTPRNFTAQDRADRMAKDLDLNEDQKAKVAELFEKQDSLRAKRRAEFKRNQQERQKAAQAKREKNRLKAEKERIARDAELESIIGKEKMEQYKKIREERMQRMKEKRDNRNNRSSNN